MYTAYAETQVVVQWTGPRRQTGKQKTSTGFPDYVTAVMVQCWIFILLKTFLHFLELHNSLDLNFPCFDRIRKKKFPVLYMNLFYFLSYFFSYFPFSSKEENFIGPISTPDLGRWQPGLPAFRPTVNISHWTSQPKIWRTFPFIFWEVKQIFSVKFSWTWTLKVFF